MNGEKVLITGVSGMLGSSLLKLLPYDNIVGYASSELNITDHKKVQNVLRSEKPDIIIHTAAYTNVEACEIESDKAYLVNVIGTQNLVNYAIENDVLFVYLSSTGIYGKEKDTPYTEFDAVNPTTVHHKSKYEAEKIVQNHLSKYIIIRTGWLFGGDKTHQKNFVYKRYLEAKDKSVIYSDNTQIGNPTYINNLVNQIMVLLTSKQYGLYNCVDNAENISRYDYVKKIIELFELPCKVKIAPVGMFQRTAPVSYNESSINKKLNLLDLNVMQNWENSLQEYIYDLKKDVE
jgi:dTDP-4-dehydrorhamnose reductase